MIKRIFLRYERVFYIAAFIATIVMVAIPMYNGLAAFLHHPCSDPNLDYDWKHIYHGLQGVHSFADTGRWWTGNWAGPYLYWRPFASYTWLIMTLAWKPEMMFPREIVLLVLHSVYLLLCGILVYKITGRKWLSLLSVYIYAGWIPGLFGGTTLSVTAVLHNPKNIPDPCAAICIVASLILIVNKRYYLALIPACMGVLFKEIGFVVWPIVPVLILAMKRRKSVPIGAVASWAAALVLCAVAHYLAVGMGYQMKGNGVWYIRMANYHLGPILAGLFTPNVSPIVTAAGLVLVVSRSRGRSLVITLLGILGALAAGSIVCSILTQSSLDVGFTQLLDSHVDMIAYSAIWLSIFYLARRDLLTALPYFVMVVIAAAPTYAALQVLSHTLYESDLFSAIFMASVLAGAFKALKTAFDKQEDKESAQATLQVSDTAAV